MQAKLLTLCMALCAVCLTATSQNVPDYVPTDGLVAWYPFNGNANDESGNGNDGTVVGASATIDRDGNLNSAYNAGEKSYLECVRTCRLNNAAIPDLELFALFADSIIHSYDQTLDFVPDDTSHLKP